MVKTKMVFGTGGISSPAKMFSAFKAGFGLFDLASIYFNEESFRTAFQNSRSPKIIYKLQPYRIGEQVKRAQQLLGISSFHALALHHVALGDEAPTLAQIKNNWRELEHLQSEGVCQEIGLSNAGEVILEVLAQEGRLLPAFLQMESHINCPNDPLLEKTKLLGITAMGYSTLMHGNLESQVLTAAAAAEEISAAGVCMAWMKSRGIIPIVRSGNLTHLRELKAGYSHRLKPKTLALLNGEKNHSSLWKKGLKDAALLAKIQNQKLHIPNLEAYREHSAWIRKTVDRLLEY